MGDEEEELLGIWGITKSWSLDIDLCNGPYRGVATVRPKLSILVWKFVWYILVP